MKVLLGRKVVVTVAVPAEALLRVAASREASTLATEPVSVTVAVPDPDTEPPEGAVAVIVPKSVDSTARTVPILQAEPPADASVSVKLPIVIAVFKPPEAADEGPVMPG